MILEETHDNHSVDVYHHDGEILNSGETVSGQFNSIADASSVPRYIDTTEIFACNRHITSLRSIRHLQDMIHLRSLNLHMNHIRVIENLNSLVNLVELDLSGNEIHTMTGLSFLTKLRRLNLSSNYIEKIDGLRGLQNIEYLSLGFNRLTSLAGLRQLDISTSRLSFIDFCGNQISRMEEVHILAMFPKLREVKSSIIRQTDSTFQPASDKVRVLSPSSLVPSNLLDNDDNHPDIMKEAILQVTENPICLMTSYILSLSRFLPQVLCIDGLTVGYDPLDEHSKSIGISNYAVSPSSCLIKPQRETSLGRRIRDKSFTRTPTKLSESRRRILNSRGQKILSTPEHEFSKESKIRFETSQSPKFLAKSLHNDRVDSKIDNLDRKNPLPVRSINAQCIKRVSRGIGTGDDFPYLFHQKFPLGFHEQKIQSIPSISSVPQNYYDNRASESTKEDRSQVLMLQRSQFAEQLILKQHELDELKLWVDEIQFANNEQRQTLLCQLSQKDRQIEAIKDELRHEVEEGKLSRVNYRLLVERHEKELSAEKKKCHDEKSLYEKKYQVLEERIKNDKRRWKEQLQETEHEKAKLENNVEMVNNRVQVFELEKKKLSHELAEKLKHCHQIQLRYFLTIESSKRQEIIYEEVVKHQHEEFNWSKNYWLAYCKEQSVHMQELQKYTQQVLDELENSRRHVPLKGPEETTKSLADKSSQTNHLRNAGHEYNSEDDACDRCLLKSRELSLLRTEIDQLKTHDNNSLDSVIQENKTLKSSCIYLNQELDALKSSIELSAECHNQEKSYLKRTIDNLKESLSNRDVTLKEVEMEARQKINEKREEIRQLEEELHDVLADKEAQKGCIESAEAKQQRLEMELNALKNSQKNEMDYKIISERERQVQDAYIQLMDAFNTVRGELINIDKINHLLANQNKGLQLECDSLRLKLKQYEENLESLHHKDTLRQQKQTEAMRVISQILSSQVS